ncbi:MAG TPA: heavy metal translocating P-type ATPase [Candidatus Lachnoclostridium avicola]|nr:heavy metal translocating P-type ATPase [Candidatus Lachnoclostridium avicola]
MKIRVEHEIKGRIRFSTNLGRLNPEQADCLLYYLLSLPGVKSAKVYERSGDGVIFYQGERRELLKRIAGFSPESEAVKKLVPECTSRRLNMEYRERLISRFVNRAVFNTLVPAPIRAVWTCIKAVRYVAAGLHCVLRRKLEVPVLDATAITVSLIRRDFKTASSVMFLLGVGELMEEWTHKKSVADLAGSMALNVDKVWLKREEGDVQIPIHQVQEGDLIRVAVGSMIPLDGIVTEGEAMVNQASLTGESIPVKKGPESSVYAGTVLEEGDLVIRVKQAAGSTRYEKIIRMLEESEKLKSSMESRAEHLADRLVPYSFLGTVAAYLITRNPMKAVSILMVDFSCALKLSMPVAVLSAMRECSEHQITVKGGKFLEALAEADTLVFDKTGTLTKAEPKVRQVVTFGGRDRSDMLRLAACLEEHFPHSIANAVVRQAELENLKHEEMHAKVSYVIAHGIASEVGDEEVHIGSRHFIFEDGQCTVPPQEQEKFESLPEDCSLLYLAIGRELAAVICIEDPLREEASEVVSRLKKLGIRKVVMMTGDSERTARAIARRVGVDEYHSEVLPEDKAAYVQAEQAAGRRVVMIGDGINDSPALSAADAGIAISEGAQLAREIADITISQDNLYGLVTLKEISSLLVKRIHSNYRFVLGFNSGLLVLGLLGVLAPGTSAFLHNMSTLGIGLHSMTNLLEGK